jgi:hypothetical protein
MGSTQQAYLKGKPPNDMNHSFRQTAACSELIALFIPLRPTQSQTAMFTTLRQCSVSVMTVTV